MKIGKQVETAHYQFDRYMSKWRWISVWHQLDEVQRLQPTTVLEIGPGPGLFKTVGSHFGITIETLDFDPDLNPDHVGSITAIPLANASYDVVCAFQVLEHLPYELSLKAMEEMARVTRRHVVISLPDARTVWRYQFHIPRICDVRFSGAASATPSAAAQVRGRASLGDQQAGLCTQEGECRFLKDHAVTQYVSRERESVSSVLDLRALLSMPALFLERFVVTSSVAMHCSGKK